MMLATMPDLVDLIKREMSRRKWKPYRLAKELRGKRPDKSNVPMSTVYDFLNNGRNIAVEDLGLILDALGLDVTIKRKPPKK